MERIGKVIFDTTYYSGQDYYSDGQVEDYLLEIVKNRKKEEYNRIIADEKDWAILYHLSPIRGNIVDWMDITKNNIVLEVGSGCGAITGTLADKAKHVTCIELSHKRSLINAYRNREKDNISIIVGNFKEIEKDITETFDYITLIGVFEYAESYIASGNSYEDFLRILKRHLKPGGKLVIAIENKFGLKYWAGCKEDHLNALYEGLEDYSNTSGVKTFSKHELEELAEKNGFFNHEFFYPYPDYKLPKIIYSDLYLPKSGELNDNLKNFDMPRVVNFDESKVYESVLKAGVFDVFSNSYLVVLSEGDKKCR